MKAESSRKVFEEDSKFHENRPVGAMRTDGQAGMTKQILALRSFANAPNNRQGMTVIPIQHSGV
jgi:hypothetical protein